MSSVILNYIYGFGNKDIVSLTEQVSWSSLYASAVNLKIYCKQVHTRELKYYNITVIILISTSLQLVYLAYKMKNVLNILLGIHMDLCMWNTEHGRVIRTIKWIWLSGRNLASKHPRTSNSCDQVPSLEVRSSCLEPLSHSSSIC
jgi:hypothetical protein